MGDGLLIRIVPSLAWPVCIGSGSGPLHPLENDTPRKGRVFCKSNPVAFGALSLKVISMQHLAGSRAPSLPEVPGPAADTPPLSV